MAMGTFVDEEDDEDEVWPSIVDAPGGPKGGRPPRPPSANGRAPQPADGVPDRDDGGIIAVVVSPDAALGLSAEEGRWGR
jgi:hypothetical protein